MDRLYTADNAKSGRSHCRWCRNKIEKGELRLAAMVQSKHHDGKDPCWYHHKCFFTKYKYVTVDDISQFQALPLHDQALIKDYIVGKVRVFAQDNAQKSGINGMVNSGEFHIEYAKSNASRCNSCDGRIAKGEVRVSQLDYTSERALIIPTGKLNRWHHFQCFVEHREKLEFFSSGRILPGLSFLQPADRKNVLEKLPVLDGFKIGYALSNYSKCTACQGKIAIGELRISHIDCTSPQALSLLEGKIDRWYHVDCFLKARNGIGFFHGAEMLAGFAYLRSEDQMKVAARLTPVNEMQQNLRNAINNFMNATVFGIASPSPSATVSKVVEVESPESDPEPDPALRDQEQLITLFKDLLNTNLKDKDILSAILTSNNQDIPVGIDRIMDRIADMMAFGVLQRCEVCQGQLEYKNFIGYQCSGYINPQIKCGKIVKQPDRLPFEIPQNLKENPAFLNYTFIPRNRIIPTRPRPKVRVPYEPPAKLPKIDKLPLLHLKFLISEEGIHNEALRIHVKNQIGRYGGEVMKKNSNKVTAIVSTIEEVRKMTARMKFAKEHCIPVISPGFANSITEVNFNFTDLVAKFLISDWICLGGTQSVEDRACQPLSANQNNV